MQKDKFLKIALLGLSGGLIISAAPADAEAVANEQLFMLAKGCPGKNGCPGAKGKKLVAENDPSTSTFAPKDGDFSFEKTAQMEKANEGNMNYKLLTEDELLLELNDEGVKTYESLTPEGKALARFVASQMCQNTNMCKGLNACATDTNSCAGKGACKGKGKCAFSDKNLAVKIVADKMAKKREEASSGQK